MAGRHPAVRHRTDVEAPTHFAVSSSRRETWAGIATAYATYTTPLRPCREDLETVERAAHDWKNKHAARQIKALLLGVTPDIATLNWPSGSTLLGLDNSMGVIKAVWPGNVRARRWSACGNWLSLPLRRRSCDIVVGDGSLNAFRYPDGWRAAAAAIRDVLASDGLLIVRCYVRPEEPETPDNVIADLLGPGIADINHFKFRLFLATQRSTRAGCPLREIYQFLRNRVSHDVLRSMPGWSEAAVNGFELWRNTEIVHTFPTFLELVEVLGPYFTEREVHVPSYELGDNCRTLLLAPR